MYLFTSERLDFRAMNRSELPAFVEVYASNEYYLAFFEPDASIDLERMRQEWDEDSRLPTWSAMGFYRRVDGVPIGFTYYLHRFPGLGTPHIGLFIIRRDLQGQGFGTEALEAFLGHMKGKEGWKSVRLGVLTENEPALGFWTARGFRRAGTARIQALHGPVEIILMERPLDEVID